MHNMSWHLKRGIKAGMSYGETDKIRCLAVSGKIHVHDLKATIHHQLGINHESLTYQLQGGEFRLIGVYGKLVHEILA